ncbi:MAG TPA: DNA translocase FtsK 4TM domain-containing protein [Oligoflexia bacterium]|nr:DNA translocase FtsK 4TM domain-containing protein [Oligoflexia bacterium]HMP47737.1 DNA translocase FtsK 4TM domain-containing protein [Oligoflexia bacterium]
MSAKRNTKSSVPRKRLMSEPVGKASGGGFFREVLSIILFCFSIFVLLALSSFLSSVSLTAGQSDNFASGGITLPSDNIMGRTGFFIARFLFEHLGYCSFSIIPCFLLLAYVIWRSELESGDDRDENSDKIFSLQHFSFFSFSILSFFTFALILSFATLSSTIFGYDGGGYLGTLISLMFSEHLNKGGTILIGLASILICSGVILNLRISHYVKLLKVLISGAGQAALDTGHVLKVGAKAGGECIKKSTSVLPFKSRQSHDSEEEYLDEDEYDDEEEDYLDDDWQLEEEYEDEDEDDQLSVKKSETKKEPARKIRKVKKIKNEMSRANGWKLETEDDYSNTEEDDCEDYEEDEDDIPPVISRGEAIKKVNILPARSLKKNNSGKNSKLKDSNSGLSDNLKIKTEREYYNYQLPTRDLLVGIDRTVGGPDDDELLENSRRLEQALKNFKLGGKVVEVHPGPIVTLYQFEPAAGIKVQRVISLADDLALALKVESVRVYAPVPGKGTVGIEVPNAEREIVRLRDVIDSEEYQTRPYALSLALGKDTYGNAFVSDLAKMPHLLIAGATGTGKSVCINSLLMSLLYRNSPSDLRLILIDPKMLELSTYESIPHLLSPVVTNPKRARGVLYWAVEEMERRYSLMKNLGVRDLAMYNRVLTEQSKGNKPSLKRKNDQSVVISLEEKDVVSTTAARAMIERSSESSNSEPLPFLNNSLSPMPRIVIVVDELADLMLTVGREIEELLTRLAQKARAAGIHLILATQRPSVNVITGLIKANFPARISFKVASKIDARTVMDQSGAERLLGQGDMLFMSPIVGRVKRLHSPFVSDQEVHDVVSWIRDQGRPDYDPEIERVLRVMEESEGKTGNFDGEDSEGYDPLYDQAVNLVIEKGQASTSMVQRVFRIGYNRAARILEVMEREGIVGPADGAKPRQVISSSSSFT